MLLPRSFDALRIPCLPVAGCVMTVWTGSACGREEPTEVAAQVIAAVDEREHSRLA